MYIKLIKINILSDLISFQLYFYFKLDKKIYLNHYLNHLYMFINNIFDKEEKNERKKLSVSIHAS